MEAALSRVAGRPSIAYAVALLEDKGHRREQILGYSRKYICQILNWQRDDKGALTPPRPERG